ncbi:hypothetical protein KR222_009239, partial [Zaprionus bogoriensis]
MDGRIVGGTATTISSFPWQISLQRSGSHSCGGSIYSANIIVTAAHCLQSVSASSLQVRAGSSYWSSGGVVSKVAAFRNHEGYNARTMINDIAIIRLSSSLSFSSTIKAISLASSNPANGAAAAVSGWGTLSSGASSLPSQLQFVNLNIVSQSKCASSTYGYGSQIKSTMICAYSSGKDSCQGDSGGPLVSGGVLVGVVSWGYGCAYANYPGVYADVAVLRSWVISVVTRVEKIVQHELYNASITDNDIALIFVSPPFPVGSHLKIATIELANEQPVAGTVATVSGWGTTTEGGFSSAQLQRVQVPLVDNEACQAAYTWRPITDGMMCAGISGGGKDACQGDSGGPLVANGQLVGIVSWGEGCAQADYPGVYAAVPHFLDWIAEKRAA